MTLRTFNSIEQRIAQLFASWHSYAGPDLHDGPLAINRRPTVLEIKNHGTHVEGFLKVARGISEDPTFSTASEEHQKDVADFIAEMTIAVEEVQHVTHHESV